MLQGNILLQMLELKGCVCHCN
uniref:Uncharacterized protein n=1 Tax=Arundo donax TaxID=35708 RepID=A0A0A9FIH7_ARUDO